MKVPASVRRHFEAQAGVNESLRQAVLDTMKHRMPSERWHWECRIKQVESFALKVETGRFPDVMLEDFYAATIVVPTLQDLKEAERFVSTHVEVTNRRPPNDRRVHFAPEEFAFDHVRLYGKLRPATGVDPEPIHSVVFELQIKTFLQHAWAIATHDLTYKTDRVSWGKKRIAAEAKSTLEAVEVSIAAHAQILDAKVSILERSDRLTNLQVSVSSALEAEFRGSLPSDVSRLSLNIVGLLEQAKLDSKALRDLLKEGREKYGGSHPANLSPYSTVVQYLILLRPDDFKAGFQHAIPERRNVYIVVLPEVEVPAAIGDVEGYELVRTYTDRVDS